VIFLGWSVSALVTGLWIEDLSGYRHRKTAISTEFSQLRSTATGSYSNFGLTGAADGRLPPASAEAEHACAAHAHIVPIWTLPLALHSAAPLVQITAARCARTLPVFVTESIQAGCRTGLAPDGPIVASRTRHAADGVVL